MFWLSHYLAVFPHEYAHALIASISGYKDHFWEIDYGGKSIANLLFLIHIDENVNYSAIYEAHQAWLVALIACACVGLGNIGTYFISLALMANDQVQKHIWFYYFCFWWNINSIGNFLDYVPSRTFTTHGDIANITQALNISPWLIMFSFGYFVLIVIWHFYRYSLPTAISKLDLTHCNWLQIFLLLAVTAILFLLYGTVGFQYYGKLSHFVSVLSIWFALPIFIYNYVKLSRQ